MLQIKVGQELISSNAIIENVCVLQLEKTKLEAVFQNAKVIDS